MGFRTLSLALVLAAGTLMGCPRAKTEAPVAPTPDPFKDVTQAAGIHYSMEPAKRPMRILESVGSGCGFVDYDGDGYQDILFVGAPRCALYHNLRNGSFEDVTDKAGLGATGRWIGCATADYDNDGHTDLLITGYHACALYHNEGDGTFKDVTSTSGLKPMPWNTAATFADFDRDGKLDLYIGAYIEFGPKAKQYCDIRDTGILTSCRPFDYDPIIGRGYRNRGDGTFEDVTQKWGLDRAHGRNLGAVVADYNRDGWPDLYLANDEIAGDLFENQKGKGFKNVGVGSGTAYGPEGLRMGGMGVDWGDYDNDGWQDLLVGTFETEAKPLFRNLHGESFEAVSRHVQILAPTYPMVVWGSLLFDYDQDGWLDLLYVGGHTYDNVQKIAPTSSYRQAAQLFHNDKGIFSPVASANLAVPVAGRGAACADFDNDGDLDLLIQDTDGHARLLRNESKGRHWLQLALRGTKSNRDAIGAQVAVSSGRAKQVGEVRTSRSYLSSCDPRLTFGLGSANAVDSVEITWPGGAKTELKNVPIDRSLSVTEGEGTWREIPSAH